MPPGTHLVVWSDMRLSRLPYLLSGGAALALAGCGGGGASNPIDVPTGKTPEVIQRWHDYALECSRLDFTPPSSGDPRATFKQQPGPCRTSRALAIVHLSMYDAVQSIAKRYKTYTSMPSFPGGSNFNVAAAQAAHDTLVNLYPAQKTQIDTWLTNELAKVGASAEKTNGIAAGQMAAQLIIADRSTDGSNNVTAYTPSGLPGRWAPDAFNPGQKALDPGWGKVRPFVLLSGNQFRFPPPPVLTSSEYAASYKEVTEYGGDGVITPSKRTADQTLIADFWAYDGAPGIGVPPRLYNQVASRIASLKNLDAIDYTRLLAMVNVSMADSAIDCWESKYYYDYWRPVTATRVDDANPNTKTDLNFKPLGAPASNTSNANFTPNFPSYPSGHASFGGALFQSLRNFFGTDSISFDFVSDELNGVTKDNVTGKTRPYAPRRFNNLSQAEEENGQSRIYQGIHWSFDKTAGITEGRQVADWVNRNAFQRLAP